VIRALEFDCDIMIKCTSVDGVYNQDPRTHTDATKYDHITYKQALNEQLKVMDMSAFGMAQENNLTSFVCHIKDIAQFVHGTSHGTLITN
jgi:uridylate kinase